MRRFSSEIFPRLNKYGFFGKDNSCISHSDRLDVICPETSVSIGQIPLMGVKETRTAIAAAKASFEQWRHYTAKQRGSALKNWYMLIEKYADDLAYIIHCEQGKSMAEAAREVVGALAYVEWYSEEAKRTYGDVIPTTDPDKRIFSMKQPLGVVAAITPWNFPLALVVRKCAPALAAGCSIVLKPSEQTPYSAMALVDLAEHTGLPDGVFNIVFGQAQEIGNELCASPDVRGLSFTGSTAIGKSLIRQCADTVKKLSMELGGNAPFIVLGDADIEAALDGLMASKFRNGGQTCVSANRIFIHTDIYEKFVDRLVVKVQQNSDLCPLINQQAVMKMEGFVDDARAKGAHVICGGVQQKRTGYYFEPTILSDMTAEMDCFEQEIFGPIACLYKFESEEEVLALANRGTAGLAAYIYTENLKCAWRFQLNLNYGVVGINVGTTSCEAAPFGGMDQSGLGREGGREGLDFYLETKYTCLAVK